MEDDYSWSGFGRDLLGFGRDVFGGNTESSSEQRPEAPALANPDTYYQGGAPVTPSGNTLPINTTLINGVSNVVVYAIAALIVLVLLVALLKG